MIQLDLLKKSKMLFRQLIICGMLGITSLTYGQQSTSSTPIPWTGTVGTDMLGRELPTWAEAGTTRPNKWFTLLFSPFPAWSNRIGNNYDVYKLLLKQPYQRKFEWDPAGDLIYPNWAWAEPWCGYYHGADPWVIRKQLIDMATSGYDFIHWDFTNAASGWNNYSLDNSENWEVLRKYLEIGTELQKQGVQVPRIALYLGSELEKALEFSYNRIYKDHLYDNMIFYYRGKPLIHVLAAVDWTMPSTTPGYKPGVTKDIDPAKFSNPAVAQQMKDFFTFRQVWDNPGTAGDYKSAWNSYGNFPSYDENGNLEAIGTTKAVGAPAGGDGLTKGASFVPGFNTTDLSNYNGQWLTTHVDKGLRNEHTWMKAHQVDPPIVLSQRYNEWYAAVWADKDMPWLGTPINTSLNEGNFTDLFNPEFSGDLEPMKDLYKDNYYWQTAGHIRLHKGVPRPELPAGPSNVTIDGAFGDWPAVKPIFYDASNDISIRDYRGNPNFIEGTTQTLWYKNTTARNDITEARVAYSDTTVFFYVKTKSAMTASSNAQWMVLFIDADRRRNTGWEGYDLRVNYQRSGNTCTIEKYENGNWSTFKNGIFSTAGNELELSLPRSVFEGNPAKLVFDFKWCDNALSANPSAMDFWENGDVAPQTRLNYRFSETQNATAFGGVAYNLPGIIEAENYDNGGEGMAFHDNTPEHLGWAYNFRYPNTAVDMDYIPGNKGIAIGNIQSGEWLAYSVYVSTTGNYTPLVSAATIDGNGAFHIEVDGVNITGKLNLANSNGAFTESLFSDKSIQLSAGPHTLKLVFEGSFSLDAWGFSSGCKTIRGAYKPLNIPGTIEAEDFDKGCPGVAYNDAEPLNLGGQYRPMEGVDIEACNEGGYDVGWIATGEWMEYTVNVATTGNYMVSCRVAGPNDNNQFHVAFDGVDKTGIITVNKTAGFQNWISITKNVTLTAGMHTMRFYVDQTNGFNINNFIFTSAGAPDLGTGTGLTGNYYNDNYGFNLSNWTSSPTETGAWIPPAGIKWFTSPAGTRTDATINVPKGALETFLSGVPNLIKQGSVSVRWTGSVEFLYEGVYTFYLSGADGLRLNVGRQNVIGTLADSDPAWVVRPYLEKNTSFSPLSGTFNVTAGMAKTKIPVSLEFYSAGVTQWSQLADRGLKLEWESTVQARGIVPQSQLYPQSIVTSYNSQAELEKVTRIYPNPVTGEKFYVQLPDYNQEVNWQILNPLGDIISSGKLNPGNRSGITTPAADGLYILNLKGNDFTHFTKLIVAH
jgi:hypothetical protein